MAASARRRCHSHSAWDRYTVCRPPLACRSCFVSCPSPGAELGPLAVMSHLILAVFFPRFVQNSAILIALFIFGIMLYLTISWLASIEE